MLWISRSRRPTCLTAALGAVVLLTSLTGPATARVGSNQGGYTHFEGSKLVKPKKVGTLRSVVEIPAETDQSRPFEYRCIYSALDGVTAAQFVKVKARYRTEAWILDHRAGTFEIHEVDSGTFVTPPGGFVSLRFTVPAAVRNAIFADGFESGDLSVFLVTRATPIRGKKLMVTHLGCDLFEP